MYLRPTEHTLCIFFDFVFRSEWSLINIPGAMGVGPNKLLVVKGLILVGYCILPDAIRPYVRKKTIRVLCVADMGGVGMRVSAVKHNKVYYPSPNKTNKKHMHYHHTSFLFAPVTRVGFYSHHKPGAQS